MIPSHVDPSVMQFAGDGAFSALGSILVAPFPIQTPYDSGTDHHVLQDMRSHQSSLPSQLLFSLFGSLAKLITNPSHGTVQFKSGQGQVMRLSRSIFPTLLKSNMSPTLFFILDSIQVPSTCGSRIIEALIISVIKQGCPIDAIFADLELPITQS